MNDNGYPHVMRLVTETPWAIRPSVLQAIREVLAVRVSGIRLSEEEIAERVASRPVAAARPPARANAGTVAVIPLQGVLMPKASLFSAISGGSSISSFRADFRDAMNDPQVGSIVIDVDSPGGTVDQIPEMAAEIRKARTSKPIVAVANTMAASGAYWLASQANELLVSPSGQVGSIGVYSAHEDYSAFDEKTGIKTTLVYAGDHKVDGNEFEPLSDEARADLQAKVDAYYAMFTSEVAAGRGVTLKVVLEQFGQGRMAMAKQAVSQGMADRVGTIEAGIVRAAQLAAGGGSAKAALGGPGPLLVAVDLPVEPAEPGESGTVEVDPDSAIPGTIEELDEPQEPAAAALIPGSERLLARAGFRRVFRPE